MIDLPIGDYFRKFLDACVGAIGNEGAIKKDARFISDLMKDFKAEKIKNLLKKIWVGSGLIGRCSDIKSRFNPCPIQC